MSTQNQIFNNIKFYKRADNAYWYSTIPINGKRVYMHKYVWEFYNSPIPKGFEVHHIDLNRDNNKIENLILLSVSEHKKLHTKLNKANEELVKKWRGNMEKAQEKAKEWHKSEAGKKWHSEHAKSIDYSKITFGERICEYCGCKYIAHKYNQRFCCNNHKSYYYQKKKRGTL